MNILSKFKDLTIESLKDNKKLIIGFYLLFIICFAGAWILSADVVSNALNNIGALNNTVVNNPGVSQVSATELFIHNELGGIITYISSIFFGIPAIILLIYNGINLGITGQFMNAFVPNGGLRYIVYLIPHGIFEITATVLQSVSGVLLFYFIWSFIKEYRSDECSGVPDAYDKTKKILIQSLILLIFSTLLLVIAAPIESYVSIPFSELVMGKV